MTKGHRFKALPFGAIPFSVAAMTSAFDTPFNSIQ